MTDTLLAWHFLPKDGRLRFPPHTEVRVGQTLRRDPEKLAMCEYGLHASVRPINALRYAPGPVICRVRLGGRIIEDDDKAVASRRTVLWMRDIERELRLFACWCVRNTPLVDGRTVWDLLADERSRHAVGVAELYADGKATKEDLAVAWDAAMDAARDVAMDATGDAAMDATGDAAGDAAGDAVWDAARHAASAAAFCAARYVARGAAWDAAFCAARNAACAAQNERLETVLNEVMGGDDD